MGALPTSPERHNSCRYKKHAHQKTAWARDVLRMDSCPEVRISLERHQRSSNDDSAHLALRNSLPSGQLDKKKHNSSSSASACELAGHAGTSTAGLLQLAIVHDAATSDANLETAPVKKNRCQKQQDPAANSEECRC